MVFQLCLYRMIQLLNVRFPLVKKGNRSKVRVLSMQNCHLNEKQLFIAEQKNMRALVNIKVNITKNKKRRKQKLLHFAVSYSSCRYVTFYHISDLRKSQKIKSRPKFLKDGDEESTISAQEGSEDHGPLRPFAPNMPNINDNKYPKENVQFTELRDIRRSVGSNQSHSKSQRIPKEDHDPSNPLFFW